MSRAGVQNRGRRLAVCALAALACLGASAARPANAPEALEDYLGRDWYYTEVIVFQRPPVMDHASDEALVTAPLRLPRNLRTFRSERPLSAQYPLYPLTHAYLAFPYLDQSLLAPWRTGADAAIGGAAAAGGIDASGRAGPPQTVEAEGPAATGAAPPPISPQLEADPLLDFLGAVADFEDTLADRSYQWLAPETFTLTAMANQLRRTAGYQVLLHGRWLQPVPARDAPEALLLEAGQGHGGEPALQGTLEVTLGRYLHFNAHLYYTEPLLGRAPVDQAVAPPGLEPVIPLELDETALTATGYMQLHQSRRLRSDEVHYVDHPKLGIIVKIQAAEPPEALRSAFEALEESEQ